MIVPRTKAHLVAMWGRYGAGYFATVPGIYGLAGGQSWTGCAMSSADMTCAQNWVSVDAGSWWLRDTAYTEPNGDYTAGCWLAVTAAPDENGELRFNDASCSYYTGTSYLCSDNAKQQTPARPLRRCCTALPRLLPRDGGARFLIRCSASAR